MQVTSAALSFLVLLSSLGAIQSEDHYVINRTAEDCNLPADVGVCKALIPMYYFDLEEKICKEFYYGGCLGNSNKFATIQECQEHCMEKEGTGSNHSLNSMAEATTAPSVTSSVSEHHL